MYIVLPFGLTSTPRIFTKVLKSLVSYLHHQGHTVIFYVDDGWSCGDTYKTCLRACEATYNLLVFCSFISNNSKSSLVPSQIISVLGFNLDLVTMTISISKHKSDVLLKLINDHLTATHTILQVAQLVGKFISITKVLPGGQQYY